MGIYWKVLLKTLHASRYTWWHQDPQTRHYYSRFIGIYIVLHYIVTSKISDTYSHVYNTEEVFVYFLFEILFILLP